MMTAIIFAILFTAFADGQLSADEQLEIRRSRGQQILRAKLEFNNMIGSTPVHSSDYRIRRVKGKQIISATEGIDNAIVTSTPASSTDDSPMPSDLELRIRQAIIQQRFEAISGIDNLSVSQHDSVGDRNNDDKAENIRTTGNYGSIFPLNDLKYFTQNYRFGDLGGFGITKIELNNSIPDYQIRTLNLMSNFLTDWTDDLSTMLLSLRTINIDENAFRIFDFSQFRLLTHLQTLSINANMIQVVCSKNIAVIPKLSRVLLNRNRIKRITDMAFAGVAALKVLDLSENLLEFLPEDFLLHHERIEKLILNHNKLKRLPLSLYHNKPFFYQFEASNNDLQWESLKPILCLPEIKTLNIGENNAENGPVIFECRNLAVISRRSRIAVRRRNTRSIHVVNLIRAGLQDINFHGTALQANGRYVRIISLDYNMFKILKMGSFAAFNNLEEIHLPSCQIERIEPGVFSRLRNLKTLLLNDNPIDQLHMSSMISPGGFLDISNTNIEYSDVINWLQPTRLVLSGLLQPTLLNLDAFCANDRLTFLDLSNNSNSALNLEMASNTDCSVEILDLSVNNLNHLPENFTKHMRNLQSLYLSGCDFKVANLKRLCKLSNLKIVDFSSNQISQVQMPSSAEHCFIETINLGRNDIKSLDTSAFTSFQQLKNLYLEYNYITDFFLNTLRWNMHSLKELDMYGNPVSNVAPIDTSTYPLVTHKIESFFFFFKNIETDLKCLSGFKRLQYLELQKSAAPKQFSLCTATTGYGNLDGQFTKLMEFDITGATELLTSATTIRMPQLITWRVYDSNLFEIDLDMFVTVAKSVRQLFLSGNQIHSVKATTMTERMHLSHLDLSRNQIKDFSFRAYLHPNEYKLLLFKNQVQELVSLEGSDGE